MQRTQIYLTDDEQSAIRQIGIRTGRSQSALIREAIDRYIGANQPVENQNKRMAAFALWQGRDDIPSLAELRSEERV
jgi:predicted DNA-binding protein